MDANKTDGVPPTPPAKRYLCIECGNVADTEQHRRPDGTQCDYIPARLREVPGNAGVPRIDSQKEKQVAEIAERAGFAAGSCGVALAPAMLVRPCNWPKCDPSCGNAACNAPGVTACDDSRDAARYRWLRATTNYVTSNGERIDVRNEPELWDRAIDAAIARAVGVQGLPVPRPTGEGLAAELWEGDDYGPTHEAAVAAFACAVWARALGVALPGWLPVATAPKDGTRTLLRCVEGGGFFGHFEGKRGWLDDNWEPFDEQPSFWLPLPTLDAHGVKEDGRC